MGLGPKADVQSTRTPVDLALVLAVDASGSISDDRWELERKGYADAFRSPQVIDAIRGGTVGAIAVTLLEWSGRLQQSQVIGWMLINDPTSAAQFSDALADIPHLFRSWTSINAGLSFGEQLVRAAPYDAPRDVIDVSGDGPDSTSQLVIQGTSGDTAQLRRTRDRLIADGFVINGLPIFGDPRISNLNDYYLANVIGGPASFMIVAESFDAFATAIERKLVEEIANATPRPDEEFAVARR